MSGRTWLLLVVCVLIGCTPASSASTQGGGATLRPTCGPADEPAVLLEVAAPAAPSPRFRLRVNGTVGELAGRSYEVRGAEGEAAFADWCDATDCRTASPTTATTATFGPLRADSAVAVRLRTATPEGWPFTWSGVATWHSQTMMCG
jgi:hypothetical protein